MSTLVGTIHAPVSRTEKAKWYTNFSELISIRPCFKMLNFTVEIKMYIAWSIANVCVHYTRSELFCSTYAHSWTVVILSISLLKTFACNCWTNIYCYLCYQTKVEGQLSS